LARPSSPQSHACPLSLAGGRAWRSNSIIRGPGWSAQVSIAA
jgi:hypothetical protein